MYCRALGNGVSGLQRLGLAWMYFFLMGAWSQDNTQNNVHEYLAKR